MNKKAYGPAQIGMKSIGVWVEPDLYKKLQKLAETKLGYARSVGPFVRNLIVQAVE